MASQSQPVLAAEFISANDGKLTGEIIRFTESTVTIRPDGGSMIMLAPDNIKQVRYMLDDGSVIEGTLLDWLDGTYVLEVQETLISAKDGAVLSETPVAGSDGQPDEDMDAGDSIEASASPPADDGAGQDGFVEIKATAGVASEEAEELVIDISSSRPSTDDIIILFTTLDGTAEAGSDFESKNGAVRLPAGETEVQLTISLIDDDEAEDDEQLTLYLSSAIDVATIAERKIAATIRDND